VPPGGGRPAGGFAPLKDCPKTLLYDLARYRNREGLVIPEETLRKQTTAQRMGPERPPPYAVLDPIVEHYVEYGESLEEIVAAGFDPDSAVLRAARRAFERTFGAPPALSRSGGTLPLLDVLARKGIDTVFTGFAGLGGGTDNIHGPNESYSLEALECGRRAARALLEELATLSGR
jgi:acetylornithine deacetylase/succinyl-diaminopimelate desuccinylase-like protein